ncbi:hypothetical protein EJD97_014048 [Solanum chilense]|uniref:WRKY domain-containing protein n=1 Tax=Solanum chilense TaxID=4083 RepID=A0A6N2B9V9_SOLCI|nr:hypothetical protein EJD97_014048 [Solanum chilense]
MINHYRKKLARGTEFVEAQPGEEVPHEDGFSWKKYGQKLVQNIPVTYGGSHNCDQAENNNQNEQLVLAVQTHVGRTTGELSEFYIHETPNNSHNNSFSNSNSVFNMNNSDFIPTPTSSPHPVDNNSRTDLLFVHDVPENTRSTYESSANDLDSPGYVEKVFII